MRSNSKGRSSQRTRRPRLYRWLPRLERLNDRITPACTSTFAATVLTVTCDNNVADSVTVSHNGTDILVNGAIVTGGGTNAKLANTTVVNIDGGIGADTYTIDESQGLFLNGATEIIFNVNNDATPLDTLIILGVNVGPNIKDFLTFTTSTNIDVNNDGDFDINLTNNELAGLKIDTQAGDDGTAAASVSVFNANLGGGIITLIGGTGNDVLEASVNSDNLMDGGDGNDTLDGENKNDTMIGGAGNDLFDADSGNDILTGGTGINTLSCGAGTDRVVETADADFVLTSTNNDVDGTVTIGTESSGFEDCEGFSLTGGAGDNKFTVTNFDATTSTPTINGGGGKDTIIAENDTTGKTTLTDNSLTMADGVVFNLEGKTVEQAVLEGQNGGADTIDASAFTLGSTTLAGQNGNDTIIGSAQADLILGNDGADSLVGGAGDDTLGDDPAETLDDGGGTDNDTIDGGAGTDMVQVEEQGDSADKYEISNTLINRLSVAAAKVNFTNVESINLLLADNGSATDGNDTVTFLAGFTLATTVDGAGGVDVAAATFEGNVILTDTALGSNITLLNFEGFSINGGAGNDTFDVTNFTKTATINAGGGVDLLVLTTPLPSGAANSTTLLTDTSLIRAGGSFPQGPITLAGFENAKVTGGAGNDLVDAAGFSGAVTISGNTGLDTLQGGFGADVIDGGLGNDVVAGGGGNDTLTGGTENDIVGGGDGDDNINLGSGDDSGSGDAGADTIVGVDGNDTLDGGTGNDNMDGGIGHDSMSGGADNDTMFGSNGRDTMSGGDGADSVLGGNGVDEMEGGAGADTLRGGRGRDFIDSFDGTADIVRGGLGFDECDRDKADNVRGCEA